MKRTLLATAAAACTLGVFIESSSSGQPPESATVVPYRIKVADNVLRDLKDRLARTRFPDEIPETGWDYGTDLSYLKTLVAYWRDKYDWRAHERALNRFDQFTTSIDGLTVHFIHQRSKNPNAMPLALTHGWPGSVYEFTKVIGPLTDPAAHGGRAEDAFHVVAISLPGFGFSDRPRARGYGPQKAAEIIAKLMARLGYTRYGLQGGDWGAIISRIVALQDPAHVAGLHLNLCIAQPPGGDVDSSVPPAELKRTQDREAFMTNERAYAQLQGTKPQSLGYGLNDSPAGLAGWIVEKFRTWCDCDGNVETRFSKDDLLTNVTIYWVTQTATSSARIYYENRAAGAVQGRVEVPTACALFPKEISVPPRKWVEARYNLVQWTEMPRGGHFAALEQPDLLVDDVRTFFRTLR